jgi:hypothetical protein
VHPDQPITLAGTARAVQAQLGCVPESLRRSTGVVAVAAAAPPACLRWAQTLAGPQPGSNLGPALATRAQLRVMMTE